MRWSWVDEDERARRHAFLGAAAWRHGQLDEAVRALGVDPKLYYGELVDKVLEKAVGAPRFPKQVEGQLDWALGDLSNMLYAQYRLFSQYTHSLMLAAASIAVERDGQLVVGRLPHVARMTILRNAVANMEVIVLGCRGGLRPERAPNGRPWREVAMKYAIAVSNVVAEHAPATD